MSGRRVEPTPLVLGHEIVGEIAALGKGVATAASGAPLRVGDRVSFTIMASCGVCDNCRGGMPQKCASLFKYGHTPTSNAPALSGGLAQYVYLRKGTAVFPIPDDLTDKTVCPANCAVATVVNGLERADFRPGERALVQGAGLLGLYAAAMLKDLGASEVVVTDLDEERLRLVRRFGADEGVDVTGMNGDALIDALGRDRFDCVVEVCGDPSVVWPGLRTLRLKGRYVIIGLVCAGADFTVDGNAIARRYLTITGIHNYAPEHLAKALAFLERSHAHLPYDEIIQEVIPLSKVEEAFEAARAKRGLRVAVKPS